MVDDCQRKRRIQMEYPRGKGIADEFNKIIEKDIITGEFS